MLRTTHRIPQILLAAALLGIGCASTPGNVPVDGSTDSIALGDAQQDAPDVAPNDVAPGDTGTMPTDTGAPPIDTGTLPTDSGTPPPTDSGTPPADSGTSASTHWVSGYYVGYQRNLYPIDAIDFAALTHLMVGRVVPRADGTLDTSYDIDPTAGPAMAQALVNAAHAHGRRAIAMLGGAGAHAGFVGAASSANRAAFVRNLVTLAQTVGYDGFDLDWEPIDTVDQPNLRALAQDLRAARAGVILTIPIGYINANFQTVDPFFASVAPLFEQMNIMSYGMAGAYSGWQSWHSSALRGSSGSTPTSVDDTATRYLAAGIPAAKLGVGIGFYGMCYSSPVTAPRQPLGASQIVADDNAMSFTNIMTQYYSASAAHVDATAQVPYLGFSSATGPHGCTYVTYEDPQSVALKGQYVRNHNLGGTIIWTINQGYLPAMPAGQRDPMMEAVRTAFPH